MGAVMRVCAFVLVLAWFAVWNGCANDTDPDASERSDTTGDSCVVVEFLYLPSEERARATLCTDSTLVIRRSAEDSTLSDVRKPTSKEGRVHHDSLLTALARIRPGTYEKDHVIDGTRIWLYHKGDTILCDNCLHDYVLEAAGAAGGMPPRGAEDIKDAVAHASEMIILAEGRHAKGMKSVKIITDKSEMKDTGRAYEVDTTSP